MLPAVDDGAISTLYRPLSSVVERGIPNPKAKRSIRLGVRFQPSNVLPPALPLRVVRVELVVVNCYFLQK